SLFKHAQPPRLSTLSLHDALPIWANGGLTNNSDLFVGRAAAKVFDLFGASAAGATLRSTPTSPTQITADQNDYNPGGSSLYLRRSEEHTSELQSQSNIVCRLLLET